MSSIPDAPFTRRTAALDDVSDHALASLCHAGQLVRPSRGLYLPAHLAHDVEARAAAISLVLPAGAALARESAAWLMGVDVRPPGRWQHHPLLECLVPLGTTRPRRPGLNAFVSDLPNDDVVLVAGVPCTSPTRTALDLARYRPRFMGLGALDAFTHAGHTSVAELEAAALPLRGHRFIRRARELIALCEPGTESMGESWTRLRLIEAGLPRPDVQISLRQHGVEVYRLDLGFVEHKVGVEYDGIEHHLRTPEQRSHDAARRADIERRFGWRVLAATGNDIFGRRPTLEDAVMELLGVSLEFRRRVWA